MTGLRNIIHVDDDDSILELSKVALEVIGGFSVVQFTSAQDALSELHRHKPDLFLLDVMMPNMDGTELLEKIREEPAHKSTPAVFMTAKADESFAKELIKMGAAGCVTKPFDPITLPDRLIQFWEASVEENQPKCGPMDS